MDETLHCCVLLCRTYLPSTGKILRFINIVLIVVQVYSFYAKVGLETTTMACPCPCQIVRPVTEPPDELVRVGSGSSSVVGWFMQPLYRPPCKCLYTVSPKKVNPLNILQQPLQTCTDLNEILHTQDDIYFCHRRQIS